MTKPTKSPVRPAKTQISLPSLIRVFAVRMKKPWALSYPLSAQWRLIRLCGCIGWSESSQGARHFVVLIFSGSYVIHSHGRMVKMLDLQLKGRRFDPLLIQSWISLYTEIPSPDGLLSLISDILHVSIIVVQIKVCLSGFDVGWLTVNLSCEINVNFRPSLGCALNEDDVHVDCCGQNLFISYKMKI